MDTTRKAAVSNTEIRAAEEQTAAAEQQLKPLELMKSIAVMVSYLLDECVIIVSPSRTFVNDTKINNLPIFVRLVLCNFNKCLLRIQH